MSSFFNVGALGGNPFQTPVGQKIELATDGGLQAEDWALNMEICDYINDSADGPKDAVKAIRKRLAQSAGKNYTIVMYTLTVLETCVKNCGKQFHILVCNKEFIQELVKLIGPKNDPPTAVQEKVLSLIQCWADAFQNQPDLSGVVTIYQDLRSKGIQFPMTDLDTMAPIYTPQRSVPEDHTDGGYPTPPVANLMGSDVVSASPQRVQASPQPRQQTQSPPNSNGALTPGQISKLQSDLSVVQGNMTVMNDMLNEMTGTKHDQHHASDLELLQELHTTLQAMQSRLVDLIAKTGGDDSLIDLSDEPPSMANLSISSQPKKPSGTGKDEFDMFAQSRNVTYESSKNGTSSYADNLDPGHANVGLAALSQTRPTAGAPTVEGNERDFDEIAAWLNAEEGAEAHSTQESVTSSDFDKFLAERAAAAEGLPATGSGQPPPQPRQRNVKKDDDSMFAL